MTDPTNFVSYLGAGGETTHALAFPNNVQAGSTLVAWCAMFNTAPLTPTDPSNTWIPIQGPITNGEGAVCQAFYVKNAVAGATTVTLKITASGYISGSMLELPAASLTAPLDQTNSDWLLQNAGNPVSIAGINGVAATAWVLSCVHDGNASTGAYVAPSGFTINAASEQDNGAVGNVISIAYITRSAGGSFTPSWTRSGVSGSYWNEANLSFASDNPGLPAFQLSNAFVIDMARRS